jgi:recombinational DNA repair protein (RecF pathway)
MSGYNMPDGCSNLDGYNDQFVECAECGKNIEVHDAVQVSDEEYCCNNECAKGYYKQKVEDAPLQKVFKMMFWE